MEPSFRIITIDKEIKFKKADLESIKDNIDNDWIKSDDYRVCSISNVRYYLELYPNGYEDHRRGQTWLSFRIKIGNAIKVQTDVVFSVDSVGFSRKIKKEYLDSKKSYGDQICTTEELFDATKNFFVIDEMIIKVKGTMKIYLPANRIVHPFSTKWKIKKANLESLKTSTDDDENSIESKDIKLGTYSDSDIECYLAFCPNDDDEESLGNARLYLYLEYKNSSFDIEVIYNISIDSANYSEDFYDTFFDDGDWSNTICSTKDLFKPENQYFVDGEMTIKITGTITMQKEDDDDSNEMECEENTVKKNDAADEEKNFIIFVEEKVIKVHKQLLLDSSPYFIGLFNSGMIESIEMKTTITDFDYEIVEAAINLLYDPKIPSNFSFEQMLELLRFSDKYDISIIKDLIQNHLIENISPINVCPLINYTTTTVSAPKLYAKCCEYVIQCSKESNAIYGLETLDKDLFFKILAETFVKNF